jgi:hypothetical protein
MHAVLDRNPGMLSASHALSAASSAQQSRSAVLAMQSMLSFAAVRAQQVLQQSAADRDAARRASASAEEQAGRAEEQAGRAEEQAGRAEEQAGRARQLVDRASSDIFVLSPPVSDSEEPVDHSEEILTEEDGSSEGLPLPPVSENEEPVDHSEETLSEEGLLGNLSAAMRSQPQGRWLETVMAKLPPPPDDSELPPALRRRLTPAPGFGLVPFECWDATLRKLQQRPPSRRIRPVDASNASNASIASFDDGVPGNEGAQTHPGVSE